MDKINITAKKLNEIEIELNQIRFKDFELGSLLSFYLDCLYRGDFDNRVFKNFLILSNFVLKSILINNSKVDYKRKIFYYRTGSKRHLNEMEKAVLYDDNLREKTFVISSKKDADLYKKNLFYNTNLIDLFKIVFFLISKRSKIGSCIKPLKLDLKTRSTLKMYLLMQLLKAESLKLFLSKQHSLKLIGADHDRGNDSSIFFTVAKALKIKNFTLQHGVINPPIGYTPLNANEIWVWGEMARLQLIELGVNESQIRKTGTPIIKKHKTSNKIRKRYLEDYKLKSGTNIVLALSSPDRTNDEKLVQFFSKVKNIYGTSNFNFYVKIHPARDFSLYSWIKDDYNIQILPQNIPFEPFVNIVDILFSHTSGLAAEALFYEKKVGILDILDTSAGNGIELNKYFKVPLIKSINDLKYFFENKEFIVDTDMIYYKSGELAIEEISNNIKRYLN